MDIRLEVPMMTLEKFSEHSGISMKTLRDKAYKGEIPTIKTNLKQNSRGALYINLVKLYQMADDAEFIQPFKSATWADSFNKMKAVK